MKFLLFLLTVGLAPAHSIRAFQRRTSTAGAHTSPSTTLKLRQPKLDPRLFRYTTLPDNGLRVLLVSDPQATEKAASAVAVTAGSLNDPVNVQGLAHFCEHMLFLGSEKYPDEGHYGKVLNSFGGNSNAYTDQDVTVYFNDFHASGMEEVLDVFAQFFVAPTFKRYVDGRARGQAAGAPVVRGRQGGRVPSKSARQRCH